MSNARRWKSHTLSVLLVHKPKLSQVSSAPTFISPDSAQRVLARHKEMLVIAAGVCQASHCISPHRSVCHSGWLLLQPPPSSRAGGHLQHLPASPVPPPKMPPWFYQAADALSQALVTFYCAVCYLFVACFWMPSHRHHEKQPFLIVSFPSPTLKRCWKPQGLLTRSCGSNVCAFL